MSLYNFFRNIFGIPNSDRSNHFDETSRDEYQSNRLWDEQEHRNYNYNRDHLREPPRETPESYHHFSMFTNPLEMHRYFEQQMDEVMRAFEGFFGQGSEEDSFGFGGFGNSNDWFTPKLEERSEYPQLEPPKSGNLREHYLRPGYEQPRNRNTGVPTDSDIDGKLDLGSLDSILGGRSRQELVPRQPHSAPNFSFSGKSISSKTIRRHDGSVEIHRTTKDHDGNEETVITKQIGDQQYSVTTRRGKDGKEEKVEDIINMDEKDVPGFLKVWEKPHSNDDPNKHFPFDKFFK